MTEILSNDALYEAFNQIIIDVRSPGEYQENHIVGAINIPLFTNEERAQIGTAYKKESTARAKKLGMSFISNKIESIAHQLIDLSFEYDRLIIYCQKGGMRSSSICDLLNALDIKVFKLEGGMKGHRQFIQDQLPDLVSSKTFVTLHGHTGVGKTKILEGIRSETITVINYEALAQNAGSVFGNILFKDQPPSQKFFEEEIFNILKRSQNQCIFIESESKRVGTVLIPEVCMAAMEAGKHIMIKTSLENRIINLIDDYGENEDHELLLFALNKLRKRISNAKVEELIDYVKNDNLEPLVEYLLTDYYDPMYQYSIDQYEYDHTIDYQNLQQAIEEVIAVNKKGL